MPHRCAHHERSPVRDLAGYRIARYSERPNCGTLFDGRVRNLREAETEVAAIILSPLDLRIRSRPNRRSPEEVGVAPEQSKLRLPWSMTPTTNSARLI